MKLRNKGKRAVKIRFLKLDSKVDPDDRDVGGLPELVIAPDQLVDVPDFQWARLKTMRPYKQWLEAGKVVEEGEGLFVIPGDGDVDCEYCHGRGFISVDGKGGIRCQCVHKRDVIANVRRIWPGYDLLKAPVLKKSPLRKVVHKDAWITCEKSNFRSHLRHVAVRQGPNWFARVRSDTDMMAGWFASAKAKSIEILDADVSEAVARDMDIQDLAEPPDLLIMILGVKRARNVATPEVLMEVLSIREHVDRPTWVVDQPTYCIEHEAHRCNSPEVLAILENYHRVPLNAVREIEYLVEDVPEGVEDVTEGPRTKQSAQKGEAKVGHRPWDRRASGRTKNEDLTVSEDDD